MVGLIQQQRDSCTAQTEPRTGEELKRREEKKGKRKEEKKRGEQKREEKSRVLVAADSWRFGFSLVNGRLSLG